jgi:microcystin-dependent protein
MNNTHYIGSVEIFAGKTIPDGWVSCDGQLLSINDHAYLFTLIGTTFGGDGRINFALPDLRGRVPIGNGKGKNPELTERYLGMMGGSENEKLTIEKIPPHKHTLYCDEEPGKSACYEPEGNCISSPSDGTTNEQFGSSATGTMNEDTLSSSGYGNSHENMAEFLVLKYIICIDGITDSND